MKKITPLLLIILVGFHFSCDLNGNDGTSTTTVTTESKLASSLSFIEEIPDTIAGKYLNSTSTTRSRSITNVSQLSDLPPRPTTGDVLYSTYGRQTDYLRWFLSEEIIKVGQTTDLGIMTTSDWLNYSNAETANCAQRINQFFIDNTIPDTDMGTAYLEKSTDGLTYKLYVNIPTSNSIPHYIYIEFILDGSEKIVELSIQELTSTEDPNSPGTYYGMKRNVIWEKDSSGPDKVNFYQWVDIDNNSTYDGSDTVKSVIRGNIYTTKANIVVTSKQMGLFGGGNELVFSTGDSELGIYIGETDYTDPYASAGDFAFSTFQMQNSNNGFLGMATGLADTNKNLELPTDFSYWSNQYLTIASEPVTILGTDPLLWDNNDTEGPGTDNENVYDDTYGFDTTGDGTTNIVIAESADNTKANWTGPVITYPSDKYSDTPVAIYSHTDFSTYFSWSNLDKVNQLISDVGTFANSSDIGIGTTVETNYSDIEGLITNVKSYVDTNTSAFPDSSKFPQL